MKFPENKVDNSNSLTPSERTKLPVKCRTEKNQNKQKTNLHQYRRMVKDFFVMAWANLKSVNLKSLPCSHSFGV